MYKEDDSFYAAQQGELPAADQAIKQQLAAARQKSTAGDVQGALAILNAVAQRWPNNTDVLLQIGDTLQAAGRDQQSLQVYRRILALQPQHYSALNSLGIVWRKLGNLQQSVRVLRSAVQLQPNNVMAHGNLGNTLRDLNLLEEAEREHRVAVQLTPNLAIAYNALGATLRDRFKVDESIDCFREALRLDSGFDLARSNLGMMLLLRGDFAEGWQAYESRKTALEIDKTMSSPRWAGEDAEEKTVLVIAEQGLGDTIQFLRYLPLIKQRAGRVILMCRNELVALVRKAQCCDEVVALSAEPPAHDYYIPMLSMARVFATDLDSIPPLVPLNASRDDTTFRIEDYDGGKLNVGLAWAGSPVHTGDRKRSSGLAVLEPLTHVDNAQFFTLQVGPRLRELNELLLSPGAAEIADCSAHDTGLAAAAGIMQQLDLVITVDTVIGHLAGTLGKPVWLLVTFAPDWRWLLGRKDSPWYPSVRLFRQPAPGDWPTVVERVKQALLDYPHSDARVAAG